jgi:DNA-binding Lrp family transcriptional regulator
MCKNRQMQENMDRILQAIPYDFPVCENPYGNIAKEAGISEVELINTLKELRFKGVIRRVAAILYHRRADYMFNAMIVWEVREEDVEKIGKIMASFPEVSHCYERERGSYWGYNIFTMIHARSLEDCTGIIQRIAEKTGIGKYEIFLSKREFKKTSLMVNND